MTFTDRTALHLANLASYYADKASAEYAEALHWRAFGWCAPAMLVKHHSEVAAHYATSARFYRDRLNEWNDGAADRAARWAMAA